MSHTRQRQLALLAIATLALLAVVVPGLGVAQEASPEVAAPSEAELIAQGEQIYTSICVSCHRPEGAGVMREGIGGIPALAGNPFVTIEDPRPVVQTVLNGRAGMPSFRGFSDEQIAGVVSYIRQAWGNQASAVDPAVVAEVREQFSAPPPEQATPIGWTGTPESATPAADGTPAEPEEPGGAVPAGVTPIPTLGQ